MWFSKIFQEQFNKHFALKLKATYLSSVLLSTGTAVAIFVPSVKMVEVIVLFMTNIRREIVTRLSFGMYL